MMLEEIKALSGIEVSREGDWVWISGDTYQHRATLKENGFRWSKRRSSWYLPGENTTNEKVSKSEQKVCIWDKAKKEEIIRANYHLSGVDYQIKSTASILKVREYYICFDKKNIKTRFCFGEHGYDYDDVNKTCVKLSKNEDYFKAENLKWFDEILEALEDEHTRLVFDISNNGIISWYILSTQSYHLDWFGLDYDSFWKMPVKWEFGGRTYTKATDYEIVIFKEAIKENRAAMEKRLDTYLKRYGMDKCHFWTYWADR